MQREPCHESRRRGDAAGPPRRARTAALAYVDETGAVQALPAAFHWREGRIASHRGRTGRALGAMSRLLLQRSFARPRVLPRAPERPSQWQRSGNENRLLAMTKERYRGPVSRNEAAGYEIVEELIRLGLALVTTIGGQRRKPERRLLVREAGQDADGALHRLAPGMDGVRDPRAPSMWSPRALVASLQRHFHYLQVRLTNEESSRETGPSADAGRLYHPSHAIRPRRRRRRGRLRRVWRSVSRRGPRTGRP